MARKAEKGTQQKAENINIRVSPKLKYGLELLSRKQRRTLTSVMEWALEKVIRDEKEGLCIEDWSSYAPEGTKANTPEPVGGHPKMRCFLDLLWSPDEMDRFLNLVFFDSSYLTYEEEVLWKLIADNSKYWCLTNEHDGRGLVSWRISDRESLRLSYLVPDWELLKQASQGQVPVPPLQDPLEAVNGDKRFIRIDPELAYELEP
jgi:predicted transcriptional regulator